MPNINGLSAISYKRKIWHKIVSIFLSINLNICFGFSKEPSHRDGSYEHPQHMVWSNNKKNKFGAIQTCS